MNKNKSPYQAYDYDNQQWVTGEAAMRLRRGQLREELLLLKGQQGGKYAQFCAVDRVNAIARLEMEIAALNGQL